jgi:hypothetical protein
MKKYILTTLILCLFIGVQQKSQAQLFKTKLQITVVDKLGNVVQDAKVTLYKNKADYEKEVNPVQEFKLSDNRGKVTFKNLGIIAYYVIVRKGDLDNFGGGEKTSVLVEKKNNKSTIVITDGL